MNSFTKISLLALLTLTSAHVEAMEPKDPLKNNVCTPKNCIQFQKDAHNYEKYSHQSMLGAMSGLGLTAGLCCFGGPILGIFTLLGSVSSGYLGLRWHQKEREALAEQWACEQHQRLNIKLQKNNPNPTFNDKITLLGQELLIAQSAYEKLYTKGDQKTNGDYQKFVGLQTLNKALREKN